MYSLANALGTCCGIGSNPGISTLRFVLTCGVPNGHTGRKTRNITAKITTTHNYACEVFRMARNI